MLTLLCSLALAGSDSDVTGVVAYDQGQYDKAALRLEEALEDPSALKTRNVAKAWLYLSRTYLAQQRFLEAGQALVQARAADTEGAQAKGIDAAAAALVPYLAQLSLVALHQGLGGADEQRAAMLSQSAEIATVAHALAPQEYLLLDVRAQALEQSGRKAEALEDFALALALAEESPAPHPDPLVGYIAYRLALLQRFEGGDLTLALATLHRGQALLEREAARLERPSEEQRAQIEAGRADLQAFELDLYLNSPDLLAQALEKFEAALAADRAQPLVLLAFASLMERQDPARAAELYAEAIQLGGETEFTGRFNLGALYVNQAAEASKIASMATDDATYRAASEEVIRALTEARPHMERAHALQPTDEATLRALEQITAQLDDAEAHRAYKAKREAL